MAKSGARESKSLTNAYKKLGKPPFLEEFLASVKPLSRAQKTRIVDQAILLLDQLYVHLPLKRARHGVNPVERLRTLRGQLQKLKNDLTFHGEMIETFKQLRDAHTVYTLPESYHDQIAFLPFLMEAFFEGVKRKFLVTQTLPGFKHNLFKRGVEVTHWNGTPVERAVLKNADREEGSNLAARFAFGLAAMTVRPLDSSLPPDGERVLVSYRSREREYATEFRWRVRKATTRDLFSVDPMDSADPERLSMSENARVMATNQARMSFFVPQATEDEEEMKPMSVEVRKAVAAEEGIQEPDIYKALVYEKARDVATRPVAVCSRSDPSGLDGAKSLMPSVFQFEHWQYRNKEYGYIRIRTFRADLGMFLGEFSRILGLMPERGLIMDVRGNGGGFIMNGELPLWLLTPDDITPARFEFISTPVTRELCSNPDRNSKISRKAAKRRAGLANGWGESIDQSMETGAMFSKGKPLTPANTLPQVYKGPVVLITDALCYSTTDIFAAGFQDHKIGEIIGVDGNTGAGGANVWKHQEDLYPLLRRATPAIERLPAGTAMSLAIRRSVRVGLNAGQPLEDLGVKPDHRHRMTKDDLLYANVDLKDFACNKLAKTKK